MLKTCSICGKIHDFNKTCKRVSTKKFTLESKFRKSYQWTVKSKQIRQRDKYLCQICIRDKYDTNCLYNYKELEVHHIVSINEDYNLRLDDMNLITLCSVKVNIKMHKKLKIKMYNFYIDSDSSESNFILFLILYELPFILIIWEWWINLSKIAFAIILSPNSSPHCPNGLFVVIIVECFSYLLFINWNSKFAPSISNGRYPTSSIMKTLYFS